MFEPCFFLNWPTVTVTVTVFILPLHEQRHFYYKTRYAPVKGDRIKNPRHGQHPERDQNEIGTRYEFAFFEGMKGQDRVAFQYTLGFSLVEHQAS